MSGSALRRDPADEIGRGPLSRGAAVVYRMLVLEGMLLLTILPTIAVVLLLGKDASNIPLFVIALLPMAPALVAAIAAVQAWAAAPDLSPARAFVLAYRRDFVVTMKWAAPMTAVLALLAFNLVHMDAVAGGAAIRPVIVVFAVLLLVWGGHMLTLTAAFRFRTRDAARIALALMLPQWRYSLGILSLLIVAVALVLAASEIALLLFLWAFAAMLALLARPLITTVTERFTTDV